MVNMNGELGANEDKWMIEKIRSCPHTVTFPSCSLQTITDTLYGKPLVSCCLLIPFPFLMNTLLLRQQHIVSSHDLISYHSISVAHAPPAMVLF